GEPGGTVASRALRRHGQTCSGHLGQAGGIVAQLVGTNGGGAALGGPDKPGHDGREIGGMCYSTSMSHDPRSCHWGFTSSMRFSFQRRGYVFCLRSRRMASTTSSCCSNQTRRLSPYLT